MTPYKSILIIYSNAVSDFRVDLAARVLNRAGYDVDTISEVPYYKAGQYDLIICSRPGGAMDKTHPGMISFLDVALDAGKPVIVDLDDDFNSIPKNNPAFMYAGPGNASYLIDLNNLLKRKNVITAYASAELEARYRNPGVVIPNSWDEENSNWAVKKAKRKTINIGFSGTKTHREDFVLVEPALHKLLAENKNLKIVINVDENLYSRFSEAPEGQKLFIPGVTYKDYPLVFKYIDILIVPLRDTVFNRAKSDIKMVEAGASKTAFVASGVPVYTEWGVGGAFVPQKESWEASLRSLIDNPDLRKECGEIGYQKAQTRTSAVIGKMWVELVKRVIG